MKGYVIMKISVEKYKFGYEVELIGTIHELRDFLNKVDYRNSPLASQGSHPGIFHFYVGKHEYNFIIHG